MAVTKNKAVEESFDYVRGIHLIQIPDYHFYRQDKSGTWSHKRGNSKISQKDSAKKIIKNPSKAGKTYIIDEFYESIGDRVWLTVYASAYVGGCGFFKITKKSK